MPRFTASVLLDQVVRFVRGENGLGKPYYIKCLFSGFLSLSPAPQHSYQT